MLLLFVDHLEAIVRVNASRSAIFGGALVFEVLQQLQSRLCIATAQPTTKTPTPKIYCASENPPGKSSRAIDRHRAGVRLPTMVRKPRNINI